MGDTGVILVGVALILFGSVSGYVAHVRGHRISLGVALGLLLGPVGVLATALLPHSHGEGTAQAAQADLSQRAIRQRITTVASEIEPRPGTRLEPVPSQETARPDLFLLRRLVELSEKHAEDQRQQTKHLQSINNIAIFWLVLTVLGIIAGCLLWFMGAAGF